MTHFDEIVFFITFANENLHDLALIDLDQAVLLL